MTSPPTAGRHKRSLLTLAAELAAKGEPYVSATVVRVSAPTSAKVGDKAILTGDGLLAGWIGGSCAEPTVIEQARLALADGNPRLVHLSPDPHLPENRDGVVFVPMTCFSGGSMEIYIEPTTQRPNVIVLGNSPVASAVVEIAQTLNYAVTVVDLSDRPAMDVHPDRFIAKIEELSKLAFRSADTFAVVATHGTFDEIAIESLVAIEPAYIGLVASERRALALRAHLEFRGVAAPIVANLRSPAGVSIGALRPEEIAVSIMAELVAVRRQAGRALAPRETHPDQPDSANEPANPPAPSGCCSKGSTQSH